MSPPLALMAALVLAACLGRSDAIQCYRYGAAPTGTFTTNLTSPSAAAPWVDPDTTYAVCASVTLLKITPASSSPYAVWELGVPSGTSFGYSTPDIRVTDVDTCSASLSDMMKAWQAAVTPGGAAASQGISFRGTYQCCNSNLCNTVLTLAAFKAVPALTTMAFALLAAVSLLML